MTYVVRFDRIGRRGPSEVQLEAASLAHLHEAIHRHVGKSLASREWAVWLELGEDGHGKGEIDGGRFGAFTVEPAQ